MSSPTIGTPASRNFFAHARSLAIEMKLEVWDSPNSAGVIIDAVRCAKLALDRAIGGPLIGPSSYFMKSPAVQHHDDEARELVEKFANGE